MIASRNIRSRSEAGFTLIEALIAIVILIFGLIAVTNLMLVAGSGNTVANHMTATTAEASEVMDLLKTIPFSKLPTADMGNVTTAGSCTNTTSPRSITNSSGVLTEYDSVRSIPGVGSICTRWRIEVIDGETRFITVRSDSEGALAKGRSSVIFTNIRACTLGATCNS